MCMLKGHTTLWVINTWQCCCLAWGNVAEGTALKPWDWLGCLGPCHLISVWNAIHSELPEPSGSSGSQEGLWGHKYICDSQKEKKKSVFTFEYFLYFTLVFKAHRRSHRSRCCDPAPGAGTRSRAPLTGGSTISHSSADGPVCSGTQTHRVWAIFHTKMSIVLFDYDVTNWSFANYFAVQMHSLWLTQSEAKTLQRD